MARTKQVAKLSKGKNTPREKMRIEQKKRMKKAALRRKRAQGAASIGQADPVRFGIFVEKWVKEQMKAEEAMKQESSQSSDNDASSDSDASSSSGDNGASSANDASSDSDASSSSGDDGASSDNDASSDSDASSSSGDDGASSDKKDADVPNDENVTFCKLWGLPPGSVDLPFPEPKTPTATNDEDVKFCKLWGLPPGSVDLPFPEPKTPTATNGRVRDADSCEQSSTPEHYFSPAHEETQQQQRAQVQPRGVPIIFRKKKPVNNKANKASSTSTLSTMQSIKKGGLVGKMRKLW
jgi:cobalamin biosynthesis Mg chelatase CobN